MICPDCSGRKESTCHVNRGSGPHTWEARPCPTCKGTGEVTAAHVERIAEGHRRREDRKARLLSLREEARRLGISPKELSDIEAGREPEDGP